MSKKVVVRFGKYKHLTFLELFHLDPDYFIALRKSQFFKKYLTREVSEYNKVYNTHVATKKELMRSNKRINIPKPMLDRGIDLMYKWVTKEEFDNILKQEFNPTQAQLKECLTASKHFYTRQVELDKINLVSLHINRYEDLFKQVKNRDFSCIKPEKQWYAQIEQHLELVDILEAKEKVVGVHSKTFKVRLNNYYQQKKLTKGPNISFDKLTIEERLELLALYDKCKVSSDTIQIKHAPKDQVVEDISFEEVPLYEETLKDVVIEEIDNQQDSQPKLSLDELKKLLKSK